MTGRVGKSEDVGPARHAAFSEPFHRRRSPQVGSRPRRRFRRRLAYLIASPLLVLAAVQVTMAAAPTDQATPAANAVTGLFGATSGPLGPPDTDTRPVELGLRFTSSVDAQVVGIRFYKQAGNAGTHTATLWSSDGKRLARGRFVRETAQGWQTLRFSRPVPIRAGAGYVASYSAPRGRYAVDEGFFVSAYRQGNLTVPVDGGVYSYQVGVMPRDTYRHSNYYVDVLVAAASGGQASGNPVPGATQSTSSASTSSTGTSSTATSGTGVTGTASSSGTASGTAPSGTATSAAPPALVSSGNTGTPMSLPRVPWEGGSAYWRSYPTANAAGWSDPSFFPIVVWYDGISTDAEVAWDKQHGINTYIGMSDTTPYDLFSKNGVYWIGDKLNSSFTSSSTNWVGRFLDDEVDGRYSPDQGYAHLNSILGAYPKDGRFDYTNYTQIVMSTDMPDAQAEKYVNGFTDAVSLDMYYYTVPFCDWRPYRAPYLVAPSVTNCRTASSYGKTLQSLRIRDAADGHLQPLWQFVEMLNGGPGGGPFTANITPGQLEGAVMNSVINEARGIVYFNQSLSGPCQTGNVIREAQVTPNFCGAAQVAAAGEINGRIRALAPLLNTQSYAWSFGTGLNTMLKADASDVYVFAMVDGSSQPGSRTFQLPPEVQGRSVDVLFENRKLTADSSGRFTDDFANEYSYHVYRIAR